MTHEATPPTHESSADPPWLLAAVKAEPRLPLVAPFMAYLLFMMVTDAFPERLHHVAVVVHIAAAGWVAWRFRRHWPPLGRPHWAAAVAAGVAAAALWAGGQHLFNGVPLGESSLGGRLSLSVQPPFVALESAAQVDIARRFPDALDFWTHVVLKILRAVTIVPIVEELFWRGFILRAFIHWDRFETVRLGQFTLVSFLGSSLLSIVQHPANWGVSILCWMFFNALFYWRKSLLFLMVTHAVTNLALYVYVVAWGDWQFW